MKVKPELMTQYLQIINEDAKGTRQFEKRTKRLDIMRDPKDYTKFTFVEVYEDEEAFNYHKNAPYAAPFFEFAKYGFDSLEINLKESYSFTE